VIFLENISSTGSDKIISLAQWCWYYMQ